jgi:hypothetical protein
LTARRTIRSGWADLRALIIATLQLYCYFRKLDKNRARCPA